jgi:carbonic anhydrase
MDFRRLVEHAREHPVARPREVGQRLASGQWPTAMFITCADSRIVPAAITGAEPGTLFELRTAGNVIPPHSLGSPSSEMATIEFAVVQLGVSDVIVCGHSHCGAVSALNGTPIDHLPTMRTWLSSHDRSGRGVAAPPADPALREEGQRHLLTQLRTLREYPFMRSGEVRVHGWFYDIETGEVLQADSAGAGFGPL